MCLCFYPILFHVPSISQGAAPLFLCLLGCPGWREEQVGFWMWRALKAKHIKGKSRRNWGTAANYLHQYKYEENPRGFLVGQQLWQSEKSRWDGGTHLWLLNHWQVLKDLSDSSKSRLYSTNPHEAGRINHDEIWHLSLSRVEPGPGFLILMLWDI